MIDQRNTPTLPAPDATGLNPDLLLGELEASDEVIAALRKRISSLEAQNYATRKYRLQAIATPVLAGLVSGCNWGDRDPDEAGSAARAAIFYAEALLNELEKQENKP